MFKGYDMDPGALLNSIKDKGWSRIVLQAPEGIMPDVVELSFFLQERGLEVSLVLDPCYGACDLKSLPEGFHGLVHIGHSMMPGQDAFFVELHSKAHNIDPLVNMDLPDNIGLAATIQHIHLIPDAKEILSGRGKKSFVGVPSKTSRTIHPGQVLGCDVTTAVNISEDVDAYVLLASGSFHAKGLAASTGKRVYSLDPHTGAVEEVTGERLLRQRHGIIEAARSGKRFGVIVSTKTGQNRMSTASRLAGELRKAGKEAIMMFADRLDPNMFLGLNIDVVVSTACPRIALDDHSNYNIPVLTPEDVRVMLGLKKWENYELDAILLSN